jgi:hypothetical protein
MLLSSAHSTPTEFSIPRARVENPRERQREKENRVCERMKSVCFPQEQQLYIYIPTGGTFKGRRSGIYYLCYVLFGELEYSVHQEGKAEEKCGVIFLGN